MTSARTPPDAMASSAATSHGMPDFSANHVIMPAIMKRPGMLKLRKFSTPIASVNATATSAYALPSISPLTSCCSSMFLNQSHYLLGAIEQLLQKARGAAERRRADVAEEGVVDGAQLRHQFVDAAPAGGGDADQRAARIVRVGALGEEAALDQAARLGRDKGARHAQVTRERAHGAAGRALEVGHRDEERVLRPGKADALRQEVACAAQPLLDEEQAIDEAAELDVAAADEQRPPRHRERRGGNAARHKSTYPASVSRGSSSRGGRGSCNVLLEF